MIMMSMALSFCQDPSQGKYLASKHRVSTYLSISSPASFTFCVAQESTTFKELIISYIIYVFEEAVVPERARACLAKAQSSLRAALASCSLRTSSACIVLASVVLSKQSTILTEPISCLSSIVEANMTRTKSKRFVHFVATSQLIRMPNADRNWYSAADYDRPNSSKRRCSI